MIVTGTRAGLFALDGRASDEAGGEPVSCLAGGADGVWAVVGGRTLLRSDDGRAWQQVAVVDAPAVRCILPFGGDLLAGTAEAHLYRIREGVAETVAGFDRVDGRDGWYTPWGGPPDTRSMSAAADGALHVNVHVGGIPRSRDGGSSWEPTIDVDADVHQVLAHPTDAGVVLAASALGLAWSRDGGDSWELETAGLHGRYCRAVAVAGDVVVVSASTGPFTRRAAVYRRAIGASGPFERCGGGLPEWFGSNVDTHCLVASDSVVVLGTSDGEVWRSEDAAATWERVASGLPAVTSLLLLEG